MTRTLASAHGTLNVTISASRQHRSDLWHDKRRSRLQRTIRQVALMVLQAIYYSAVCHIGRYMFPKPSLVEITSNRNEKHSSL